MLSVWFFGFVGFILARTFYAGMNTKTLFYRNPKYGEVGPQICEDKVGSYVILTIAFSLTWPISLPGIGIYKLGKRFSKEK
jgi:hypothetical protein